ncbi:MAG: Fic family protein [Spirochaetales bacterium]|nr:Fic family protein [Spirochaetales bacterium]
MEFISVSEASLRWGISDRRIRTLCSELRIDGAVKIGRNWMIPQSANYPMDARLKSNKNYSGLDDYDFSQIDKMILRINQQRPFPKRLVESLREKLVVDWTYNSNAIEGNTLTLSETKVVLEGITIGGKTLVEHLEAINHREAIFFIEKIISNREELSEWNIKNIHALILRGIDSENAGKYREENVVISSARHIPPRHYEIRFLMQQLIIEYSKKWKALHPIVKSALLHGEFVKIHPFIDGNGRTSRLLLNFQLMQDNYLPIIIKKEYRAEYYQALDIAHTTSNYQTFIKLIADAQIEAANLWLSLLDVGKD